MAGILHSIIAPFGAAGTAIIFVNDTANVNLRNILLANGWDGISVVTQTVIIESTAKIYSTSTSTPAFDTGSLPVGSVINITNNGYILGKGGRGGNSARPNGLAGSPGGTALKVQATTNLTNNGIIGGGGGGGGSGGMGTRASSPGFRIDDGGAGGGGIGNGEGGAPLPYSYAGGNATLLLAGAGGPAIVSSGAGGNGGFYGASGIAGNPGSDQQAGHDNPGGPGGAPGKAVEGNSNITWLVTGTIYGAVT